MKEQVSAFYIGQCQFAFSILLITACLLTSEVSDLSLVFLKEPAMTCHL